MPLFEVAIIQKQTKKEAEDGIGGEKLLMKPTFVLAKDGQTAAIVAVMGGDAPKNIDMSRAEVYSSALLRSACCGKEKGRSAAASAATGVAK